ncbi:MAG: RIP metalloprotease RseP, partial [Verrucomicrobia bacterium GWC2_42_7]
MGLGALQHIFQNFWAIFLVILFFGGSIFIHELGHFLAAKRRGLRVPRFSIGFGPKLFSWKCGETEFCLSLFPLGGYVALPQLANMEVIEGTKEESPSSQKLPPISYLDKVIVAVMGAVFNALLAFALAIILWQVGFPSTASHQTTVIGYVHPKISVGTENEIEGPAYLAGLQHGDRILKVDGKSVSDFGEINKRVVIGCEREKDGTPLCTFTVQRGEKLIDIQVHPKLIEMNSRSGDAMRFIGISPAEPLVVADTAKNSPAEGNFIKNDEIVSLNGKTLYSIIQLNFYLRDHPSEQLTLTIKRGNQLLSKTLTPKMVAHTRPYLHIDNQRNTESFCIPLVIN